MQGFFHLLLEAYISETLGAQRLREIRQLAGMQGPPLATEYYPDQITSRLIQAISDQQHVSPDDVWNHFGIYFMNAPLVEQHYRAFLEGPTSAHSFLVQVPTIHRLLAAHLKGVSFPQITFVEHAPELLEVVYDSPRRLCSFLLGMIEGVGIRFHEALEVREMECQHRGAPACRVLVRFLPVRRSGALPQYPSLAGAPGSGPYSQSSAPGFSSRGPSGPLPRSPLHPVEAFGPREDASAAEARRKREEAEDILILQTLASDVASRSHALPQHGAHEQPLGLALSLFEINQRFTTSGVPAEQSRLSLIQRALTRLAVQGFIEAKLDPYPTQPGAPPGLAALGGQGILAAQRYRITSTGRAWLREKQRW